VTSKLLTTRVQLVLVTMLSLEITSTSRTLPKKLPELAMESPLTIGSMSHTIARLQATSTSRAWLKLKSPKLIVTLACSANTT
jgi:hypothetical protein